MDERIIPASMQAQYDNFHFAPAVRVGDLLLCSGQIGTDASGACQDDPEAQFTAAFEGLKVIVEEAGGSMADVVEMTTYHTDMAHLGTFMKVKDRFVAEPYPAWTAIGCTELALPGALVEIRAQAHLG